MHRQRLATPPHGHHLALIVSLLLLLALGHLYGLLQLALVQKRKQLHEVLLGLGLGLGLGLLGHAPGLDDPQK